MSQGLLDTLKGQKNNYNKKTTLSFQNNRLEAVLFLLLAHSSVFSFMMIT